ncbi:MAG: glycosyltransferase [Clostridium lundense]|nr:glycosyltransferase [Clostridium lundense]
MAVELSVAIIFKNEIRCIERCLKSLLPLKERFSCEIVMADTGSTDGSRVIAEQYADDVFNFPWVNDFSAARNAVLARCHGAWMLVIDCDEWLAPDLDALEKFLHGKAALRKHDGMLLTIRNYLTPEMDSTSDFMTLRLLRAASSPRYEGVIHEHPVFRRPVERECSSVVSIVLYHDGYVMFNDGSEAGEQKRDRNRALMEKLLEQEPESLRVQMQYLESLKHTDEKYDSAVRRAMELTRQKKRSWEVYGPVIFREAMYYAFDAFLPELRDWGEEARQLFPKSYFTRLDVNFILMLDAMKREDDEQLAAYAEAYLRAYKSFSDDPQGKRDISRSTLQRVSPYWAQYVRLRLAGATHRLGNVPRALELLDETDWTLLDERHTTFFISLLTDMAKDAHADVGVLLSACWNGIQKPIPSPEAAAERIAAFRKLVGVEKAASAEPETVEDGVQAELRQLAAKVKAILAKYPADDPAIIDLKNSEAYQKVKHLIEG